MWVILTLNHLDGVCAAAVLVRLARLRKVPYKVLFSTYTSMNQDFSELSSNTNSLIFIVDISPDDLEDLSQKLGKLTKKNKLAYWSTTQHCLEKNRRMIESKTSRIDIADMSTKTCATDLVKKRFLDQDSVGKELSYLAHDWKFWERKNDIAGKLAELIAVGPNTKKICYQLATGVLWSEEWEKMYQELIKKKTKALQDLLTHLVTRQYVTNTFGFSLAESFLLSAEAGEHILDKHEGVDVACVLYRDGTIVFRRRNSVKLNLKKIAQVFQGGGHSFAAGGKLGTKINRENFSEVLFGVDQLLKKFFL